MPRLNVQADVRSYLAASLDGVEVRVRVPDPRPERLVVVTREGGRRLDALRDRAGVGVLVWAPTEAECQELADEVADLMFALNGDFGFRRGYDLVEEEALYSDADTETRPDTPRWYGSYTITTHRY